MCDKHAVRARLPVNIKVPIKKKKKSHFVLTIGTVRVNHTFQPALEV